MKSGEIKEIAVGTIVIVNVAVALFFDGRGQDRNAAFADHLGKFTTSMCEFGGAHNGDYWLLATGYGLRTKIRILFLAGSRSPVACRQLIVFILIALSGAIHRARFARRLERIRRSRCSRTHL